MEVCKFKLFNELFDIVWNELSSSKTNIANNIVDVSTNSIQAIIVYQVKRSFLNFGFSINFIDIKSVDKSSLLLLADNEYIDKFLLNVNSNSLEDYLNNNKSLKYCNEIIESHVGYISKEDLKNKFCSSFYKNGFYLGMSYAHELGYYS